MSKVELTPFERAVCAWILNLPGTWTTPQWDELTHTLDKAMNRLVKGGFVEARLPVTLNVSGEPQPIRTVWRVTGNYGPVLHQQIQQYLLARGLGSKEAVITCGEYSRVRLTAEGELAKQDFRGTVVTETSHRSDGTVSEEREPGTDYFLFRLVAGGPDGEGGVKPKGTVHFEADMDQGKADGATMSVPQRQSTRRLATFISYSHKDEAHRERLDAHLALLKRDGVITIWHDREILPGKERDATISSELESADIILLLVSADFLTSKYCYEVETQRAIERHEAGTAIVIPIIVEACEWQAAPFGKLLALPKDGKPVATWRSEAEAWSDVAAGISRAAEAVLSRKGSRA